MTRNGSQPTTHYNAMRWWWQGSFTIRIQNPSTTWDTCPTQRPTTMVVTPRCHVSFGGTLLLHHRCSGSLPSSSQIAGFRLVHVSLSRLVKIFFCLQNTHSLNAERYSHCKLWRRRRHYKISIKCDKLWSLSFNLALHERLAAGSPPIQMRWSATDSIFNLLLSTMRWGVLQHVSHCSIFLHSSPSPAPIAGVKCADGKFWFIRIFTDSHWTLMRFQSQAKPFRWWDFSPFGFFLDFHSF